MSCSPPTFHIRTLGCKVNQAESDKIAAALNASGWARVGVDTADVCIVNTCTVTGEAETKNRKVIRQLLRACRGPVIVTGCAINIARDHYRALDSRVVAECDKGRVPELADELLERMERGGAGDARGERTSREASQIEQSAPRPQRTRASVKVQDGCDNACAFCIVHTARGPARSVPARDVISEVNNRCDRAPELVLVGIDLAAYRDGGTDLAELLRLLQARTNVGRMRITSIEPQSITGALVDELAESAGRVCRHLHLCLQSGSTKVLREMNRHYSAERFVALVDELRARVPGIALSTDVIVGFPGETDDDFQQTCEVVQRCGFMKLHVFRYSKRPGTPAAERDDQIAPELSAARARKLVRIGDELARADRAARVGTSELVVVERAGRGTSESYHEVRFSEDLEPGALVEMRFTGIDEQHGALVGIPQSV